MPEPEQTGINPDDLLDALQERCHSLTDEVVSLRALLKQTSRGFTIATERCRLLEGQITEAGLTPVTDPAIVNAEPPAKPEGANGNGSRARRRASARGGSKGA